MNKDVYYEKKSNAREIKESIFIMIVFFVYLTFVSYQSYVEGMKDERERFIEKVSTYEFMINNGEDGVARQFYSCMDKFDWEKRKENR